MIPAATITTTVIADTAAASKGRAGAVATSVITPAATSAITLVATTASAEIIRKRAFSLPS